MLQASNILIVLTLKLWLLSNRLIFCCSNDTQVSIIQNQLKFGLIHPILRLDVCSADTSKTGCQQSSSKYVQWKHLNSTAAASLYCSDDAPAYSMDQWTLSHLSHATMTRVLPEPSPHTTVLLLPLNGGFLQLSLPIRMLSSGWQQFTEDTQDVQLTHSTSATSAAASTFHTDVSQSTTNFI